MENNKNNIVKFIVSVTILFMMLFFIVTITEDTQAAFVNPNIITIQNIKDEKANYNIDVYYPKFQNDELNKIITDYIFRYIKDFKSEVKDTVETLKIDYMTYYAGEYINVFFDIKNTIKPRDINHNIFLNTEMSSLGYITDLFEVDYLKSKIDEIVTVKYPKFVSSVIKESNINNYVYYIDETSLSIYFSDLEYEKEISYTPKIKIDLESGDYEYQEEHYGNKKYIAITFDDGPSEYTEEILKVLNYNNSKATFFMLGNMMKYKSELVLNVHNSGNEIASHSYAHKNFSYMKKEEMISDLNNCNSILNNITGGSISLFRPAYGSYDSEVRSSVKYPIILWNIDPKDWATRNASRSYENIIKNAHDGGIILLHDVYSETVEAVKMILPELKAKGYEIVSVSDLALIKNVALEKGKVYTSIK